MSTNHDTLLRGKTKPESLFSFFNKRSKQLFHLRAHMDGWELISLLFKLLQLHTGGRANW